MVRGEWYAKNFGSNGGGDNYNLFQLNLLPPKLNCFFMKKGKRRSTG